MSATTDWASLSFIVQTLGFIGVIIAIVTATYKITSKFKELEIGVNNLKDDMTKAETKLEDFTVNYKVDILVKRAREELIKDTQHKEEHKNE